MKELDKSKAIFDLYVFATRAVFVCKKYSRGQNSPFTAIMELLSRQPMTVRGLSVLFSVKHSYMSLLVSRMEKLGLVKKVKSKDKRFRLLTPDPQAKKIYKVVNKEFSRFADVAFEDMTKKEVRQLLDLIGKVNLEADDYVKDQDRDLDFIFKE